MVINSTTNSTTKRRRIQLIETIILGSREDTIWIAYQICVVKEQNTIFSSLSYKKGVSLRHNHLHNITANLIDKVCHDVRVEAPLQTLTGETFDSRSTNVMKLGWALGARGFWTKHQMVFFDLRVFDPNAKTLKQCHRTNEMGKKRKYNKHILQLQNGRFTQLVFSVNDGIRKKTSSVTLGSPKN